MHYPVKNSLLILMMVAVPFLCLGQEDELFQELDGLSQGPELFELPAFKALQIGNLQSTKVVDKGDLYLVVAHRFGDFKNGISDFFGLDQANTKIQLLYGVISDLQLGVSRDSYEKTYSGTLKYRLYEQSMERPLNISLYGSVDINTQIQKNIYPGLKPTDRYSYSFQVLSSRRFTENLSLQIAPIYVRHNLVDLNFTQRQSYNQFLLATGGRYKLSKRFSVNLDYAYNFSRDKNSLYHNPLTVGVDIETGGHVFQLLFTNSRASNDSSFLTETTGDWAEREVSFGFNIVRVF